MSGEKVFGVLLTEAAWNELAVPLQPYTSEGTIGKYIYCQEVHVDGPYFVMVASCRNPDGSTFAAEIGIPHYCVKLFVSAANQKQLGFTA